MQAFTERLLQHYARGGLASIALVRAAARFNDFSDIVAAARSRNFFAIGFLLLFKNDEVFVAFIAAGAAGRTVVRSSRLPRACSSASSIESTSLANSSFSIERSRYQVRYIVVYSCFNSNMKNEVALGEYRPT